MVTVNLQSHKQGEINKFLSKFYNTNVNLETSTTWKKDYKNPIEISDIIGAFIDNLDSFDISMWICLDKNIFINITNSNANEIIKYLFERYPY